jgi:hypothetical protein
MIRKWQDINETRGAREFLPACFLDVLAPRYYTLPVLRSFDRKLPINELRVCASLRNKEFIA